MSSDEATPDTAQPGSIALEPQRQPPGDWPGLRSVPLSVLVPVKNEEANIVECLRTLSFADEVVVVDSGSTDRTVELAEAMGAKVVQFRYSKEGWPKKKNWALEHVPWRNEWVLILDADERLVAPLAREIEDVVHDRFAPTSGGQKGDGDGYYLNRRFIFMGRWIKHCGYYPSYNLRLFKHKLGRYERIGNLGDTGSGDNEVHEHVILRNGSKAGVLKHDFLHLAYPNLQTWIEKHNRYSNWEAYAMRAGMAGELHASLMRGSTERRRWIKRKVRHLPFRPTLRFLYSYVLQFGFLDGYAGYALSRLMSWYEFVSLAKRHELELAERLQAGASAKGGTQEYEMARALGPSIATTPPTPNVTDMPVLIPHVEAAEPKRVAVPQPQKPDEAALPEDPAARFPELADPADRVLITGGSGFIGTNLVEYYWKAGATVINVDYKPPRKESHEGLWCDVDICDRGALEAAFKEFQPTIVHHLAARTDLEENLDLMGYDANMKGVQNLIDVLEQTPSVERTIFTSTQLVCRPSHEPRWDMDYCPHTMYGTSKVVTEAIIRGWHNPTCTFAIVRPTSIWGPWFSEPYKTFFLAVARRIYRHQRGFNPLRSFGFVGNMVYQYAKLAKVPADSIHEKMFYMADYEPIRVREWANIIQQEMGIKPLKEVGYTTLRVAAFVGDMMRRFGVQNPTMTSFRLRNLISDNTSDTGPMAEACGPLPYSVHEGVRMTIDWLEEHGEIESRPTRTRTGALAAAVQG